MRAISRMERPAVADHPAAARRCAISNRNCVRISSSRPTRTAEARDTAGVAQAMEAVRDQRGLPWLEDLARDIRYGFRMLAVTPGFTLSRLLRWRLESARTARSSASPTPCCSAH